VNLIITDPPYGSNVQYGELSSFWLVWLRDELRLPQDIFSLKAEVVVHRKKKDPENYKDYEQYFTELQKVFAECFRVLKPGAPMVFTFNNKDVKAWYAVIRAAIQSGLYLDEKGVIYQDPIENYKNTAHTRFAGSLHGDFIYTFVKPISGKSYKNFNQIKAPSNIQQWVEDAIRNLFKEKQNCTINEIYIEVYTKLIPVFASLAESDEEFAEITDKLGVTTFEQILNQKFLFDKQTKTWCDAKNI
jgi:DNA modification methylase